MKENDSTDFGFKTVPKNEKADLVEGIFNSVADRYDLMNDLMSIGIHRIWKRFTIELSAVREGNSVLDIAGGTGDLAIKFSDIVGSNGTVVLADINESMLNVGRDKLLDKCWRPNINFVQTDAQKLPFPDATFECITIAFGLRNVTDKSAALKSMYRALKPGGRLLILEFSKPTNEVLARAYDAYSFHILPLMGKIVANDSDSYKYLAESIRMHPDQEALQALVEDAGFSDCDYYNMTGGIVAIHRGIKNLDD